MKIHQTSNQVSDNRWQWSISLDASNEELDLVEKVTYHLHPTFNNNIVVKTNRQDKFKLETSGWGTFVVRVEVCYLDNRIEELRHRLVFKHEKPKLFISHSSSSSEDSLLETLKKEADQLGWEISTSEDVGLDEDMESAINKKIDESQLFVMIGGDSPSRWVMNEFKTAEQLGKKALVIDSNNLYGISGSQNVTNDSLVSDFKAYDFEMKGK